MQYLTDTLTGAAARVAEAAPVTRWLWGPQDQAVQEVAQAVLQAAAARPPAAEDDVDAAQPRSPRRAQTPPCSPRYDLAQARADIMSQFDCTVSRFQLRPLALTVRDIPLPGIPGRPDHHRDIVLRGHDQFLRDIFRIEPSRIAFDTRAFFFRKDQHSGAIYLNQLPDYRDEEVLEEDGPCARERCLASLHQVFNHDRKKYQAPELVENAILLLNSQAGTGTIYTSFNEHVAIPLNRHCMGFPNSQGNFRVSFSLRPSTQRPDGVMMANMDVRFSLKQPRPLLLAPLDDPERFVPHMLEACDFCIPYTWEDSLEHFTGLYINTAEVARNPSLHSGRIAISEQAH